MTKQEVKAFYKNKLFFEVIKNKQGLCELNGPLPGIRHIEPEEKNSESAADCSYRFVQIVGGLVIAAFKADEIVILDAVELTYNMVNAKELIKKYSMNKESEIEKLKVSYKSDFLIARWSASGTGDS